MNFFKMTALSIALALPLFTQADISGDLDHYFDQMGFSSNTTSPSVVQGQEAGYLSGGSLYLRSPVKDTQIAQINIPSINAGCGGIDLFGGSLSFISSAKIVETFRALLKNVPGVAFQIAMQTFAPQLNNILSDARSWMNQINNINMSSCTSAYAIAGLVTKGTAANQAACSDLNTQGGQFADWAASAVGCSGKDADKAYADANATDKGKLTLLVNKNIVWVALNQDGHLQSDPELMQFLMSVTGTISFDDKGTATYYESLAKGDALLNLLLHGAQGGSNTAKYYACDNLKDCLKPQAQNLAYRGKGLVTNVANSINDIQMRLDRDLPLTKADESLLSSIPYPLLHFMMIAEEGHIQLDFSQFAEAIADQVLIHYLAASAEQVRSELVQKTNFPADSMQEIYDNISKVTTELNTKYARDSQSMAQTFNILQNLLTIKQSAISQLSSQSQVNLQFGAQ